MFGQYAASGLAQSTRVCGVAPYARAAAHLTRCAPFAACCARGAQFGRLWQTLMKELDVDPTVCVPCARARSRARPSGIVG